MTSHCCCRRMLGSQPLVNTQAALTQAITVERAFDPTVSHTPSTVAPASSIISVLLTPSPQCTHSLSSSPQSSHTFTAVHAMTDRVGVPSELWTSDLYT